MTGTELTGGGRYLAVDHSLCSGTGHCQDTAPDVFLLDRQAWLIDDLDLASVDAERLTRAAAGCPWFAITFYREEEA
ncbi:ferredoxin [Saccharopolyspora shandongensis]|uniref:ferredoxin n=1 Tax=Saccharopolyspora shandongensis TaxID=418495 RepID=UPI0033E9CBAF